VFDSLIAVWFLAGAPVVAPGGLTRAAPTSTRRAPSRAV